MEKQFREPIFKSPSPLSEVVPYRDGLVTISVSLERLKLDFLEEAKKRDVDLTKAEDTANNLQFFLTDVDYTDI